MASRLKELAKIHIGAGQLGFDDDAYRDFLYSVSGKRSSADLDERGRRKVIREMRRLGVEFHPAGKRPLSGGPEKRPLLGKIRALLADAGRPEEYAEAILRNMTKHSHRTLLAWGTPKQLHDVAAALMIDQRRRKERGQPGVEGRA